VATLAIGLVEVGSSEKVVDDCGVVEAGVGAVDHTEKQIRPDVIDRATVPSTFHGFR
jgi:hypothetical protein